jgi:hypothetical protein
MYKSEMQFCDKYENKTSEIVCVSVLVQVGT